MADECAQLLKSVCALKGINQSEWVYQCVREDFVKRAFEDQQVQQIVLAGTYQPGSNAYRLKEQILKEQKTWTSPLTGISTSASIRNPLLMCLSTCGDLG